MTSVLYKVTQATLVTTAWMHSFIIAKIMATSSRIVQTRSLHQEHHITTIGHAPNHVTTTTVVTDPSPLTTDTAKGDVSTSQDHTSIPTVAEAPATIGDTHPTTAAAHTTHQLTDALDNPLTRTHHTGTMTIHLNHTTFPLESLSWLFHGPKLI